MYMEYIDYDKDFVFMTDKSGNLTSGGFKIQSDMLHNTINGMDGNNSHHGGSRSILHSFKDLVIPAGLYFQDITQQYDRTIKYSHNSQQVEDSLYNKLLDLVSPDKRKVYDNKTRRKKRQKKIMTKKQRH